jgi:alkylation response protein AidB-like acyl-CoA dehydrogenase
MTLVAKTRSAQRRSGRVDGPRRVGRLAQVLGGGGVQLAHKQFGVTPDKCQALTQRAAEMYVSLEPVRSMSLYASMSIAGGNLDPVIASRPKLQIGHSGRHIARSRSRCTAESA